MSLGDLAFFLWRRQKGTRRRRPPCSDADSPSAFYVTIPLLGPRRTLVVGHVPVNLEHVRNGTRTRYTRGNRRRQLGLFVDRRDAFFVCVQRLDFRRQRELHELLGEIVRRVMFDRTHAQAHYDRPFLWGDELDRHALV